MVSRLKVSLAAALLAAGWLAALWPALPAAARPPLVEEAAASRRPAPRAHLRGDRIHRDRVTRNAIHASARLRPAAVPAKGWSLRITKSRYRLDLLDGQRPVKVYPVAFGGDPRGDKRRRGDRRTPEGSYRLIPHHPSPRFGPCFYLCYPAPEDAHRGVLSGLIDLLGWRDIVLADRAAARPPWGTPLGGLILIHGTRDRRVGGLTRRNWTLGCVAMENDHLEQLLGLFAAGDRPRIVIAP